MEIQDRLAPYVSPVTFWGFLEKLKQGVPAQMDKSMFNGYSGGAVSQIVGALKHFGLVLDDGDNTTTQKLHDLVGSEGDGRQALIKQMVLDGYPFMRNGFDLKTATQGMLDQKFKDTGAKGDTVRKCGYFFMSLAKDAGFEVSTHLRAPSARPTSVKRKPKKAKPLTDPKVNKAVQVQNSGDSGGPNDFYDKLLDKLPEFNPEWDKPAQEAWMRALDAVSKAKGFR